MPSGHFDRAAVPSALNSALEFENDFFCSSYATLSAACRLLRSVARAASSAFSLSPPMAAARALTPAFTTALRLSPTASLSSDHLPDWHSASAQSSSFDASSRSLTATALASSTAAAG